MTVDPETDDLIPPTQEKIASDIESWEFTVCESQKSSSVNFECSKTMDIFSKHPVENLAESETMVMRSKKRTLSSPGKFYGVLRSHRAGTDSIGRSLVATQNSQEIKVQSFYKGRNNVQKDSSTVFQIRNQKQFSMKSICSTASRNPSFSTFTALDFEGKSCNANKDVRQAQDSLGLQSQCDDFAYSSSPLFGGLTPKDSVASFHHFLSCTPSESIQASFSSYSDTDMSSPDVSPKILAHTNSSDVIRPEWGKLNIKSPSSHRKAVESSIPTCTETIAICESILSDFSAVLDATDVISDTIPNDPNCPSTTTPKKSGMSQAVKAVAGKSRVLCTSTHVSNFLEFESAPKIYCTEPANESCAGRDNMLTMDSLTQKIDSVARRDLSSSSKVSVVGNCLDQGKTSNAKQKNTIFKYFKVKSPTHLGSPDIETAISKSTKLKTSSSLDDLQKNERVQSLLKDEPLEQPQKHASSTVQLFDLPISPRQTTGVKRKRLMQHAPSPSPGKRKEQLYLDIGQKDFGHVTCSSCGMVYTKCQDDDEAQHAKYHQKVLQKLKFNGWKSERVVQEFFDGRILEIRSGDPQNHIKKLQEVQDLVDAELGFASDSDLHPKADRKAYLFVAGKKVIGCAIAVPIIQAFPAIALKDLSPSDKKDGAARHSWCCSSTAVPALCGISRIWVFAHCRHKKIATRLVDCIRHNFIFGCVIPISKVAFSDPTPHGRAFAEAYTGTPEILVFR